MDSWKLDCYMGQHFWWITAASCTSTLIPAVMRGFADLSQLIDFKLLLAYRAATRQTCWGDWTINDTRNLHAEHYPDQSLVFWEPVRSSREPPYHFTPPTELNKFRREIVFSLSSKTRSPSVQTSEGGKKNVLYKCGRVDVSAPILRQTPSFIKITRLVVISTKQNRKTERIGPPLPHKQFMHWVTLWYFYKRRDIEWKEIVWWEKLG